MPRVIPPASHIPHPTSLTTSTSNSLSPGLEPFPRKDHRPSAIAYPTHPLCGHGYIVCNGRLDSWLFTVPSPLFESISPAAPPQITCLGYPAHAHHPSHPPFGQIAAPSISAQCSLSTRAIRLLSPYTRPAFHLTDHHWPQKFRLQRCYIVSHHPLASVSSFAQPGQARSHPTSSLRSRLRLYQSNLRVLCLLTYPLRFSVKHFRSGFSQKKDGLYPLGRENGGVTKEQGT